MGKVIPILPSAEQPREQPTIADLLLRMKQVSDVLLISAREFHHLSIQLETAVKELENAGPTTQNADEFEKLQLEKQLLCETLRLLGRNTSACLLDAPEI